MTCLTTLAGSLIFLIFISQTRVVTPSTQNFRLYAALPESTLIDSDSIVREDARAKIIANFFKGYGSPLQAFSVEFIQVSDKYNLDYRLLPSISMQESNGAKKIITDSNNPFGYGIYGGKVMKFDSYADAIERVGRGIKEDYIDQGLKTPNEIMAKYTPPSLAKGGAWAKGVSSFMSELE